MHPRQAALLEFADGLTDKLTGKEAAGAPVLWKYVDPDGGEFFLPSRRQNVHSPYTGKSCPQRPEKYQIGAVGKELREEQKGLSGAPGPKTSNPRKKTKKADDLEWKVASDVLDWKVDSRHSAGPPLWRASSPGGDTYYTVEPQVAYKAYVSGGRLRHELGEVDNQREARELCEHHALQSNPSLRKR